MKKIIITASVVLSTVLATAQWSNKVSEPYWVNTENEYFYGYDLGMACNDNAWLWLNWEGDTHYVQLFDTTGVALLGEKNMLVSDHQDRLTGYVNQNLFVDSNGDAIVVVSDLRHSSIEEDLGTYTAYKISQTGEMLWGEDGVLLDSDMGTYISAMMGIAEMSDGSYVFTWTHSNNDAIFSIEVQRVSADGELLWNADETRLTDPEGNITYFWPYIVDAGYGQSILVYTKGSGSELYARKLDFDGTPVWSKDTRIYNGGFLSTPLWTLLCVKPSGDGGVIVTWYDDRYYSGIESIYMSYVKSNGELGFASGAEGQKLCYSENRALSTTCTYDPASDSFIAFWRESTPGQGSYRIVAQSVSKDGELLWGENGLEIEPMGEYENYDDLSIRTAREGEVALFYMKRNSLEYGNVDIRMQLLDTRNGVLLWDESRVITDTISPTEKTDMKVTDMASQKFWIFGWDDRGVESDPNNKWLYLQRVNYDGTVGNPGNAAIDKIETYDSGMTVAYAHNKEVVFAINSSQASQATLAIYNTNGQLVATPFSGTLPNGQVNITWQADVPAGVYLATLTTAYGVEAEKIFVKQ